MIEPRPMSDHDEALRACKGFDLVWSAIRKAFPVSHPDYWRLIAWRFLINTPTDPRLAAMAVARGYTNPSDIKHRKTLARLWAELGLELEH